MIYNAVLVGCTKGFCYTHMYLFFFKFFSHLGYYRIFSRVPCAIHRSLLVTTLNIVVSISQSQIPTYPAPNPTPPLVSIHFKNLFFSICIFPVNLGRAIICLCGGMLYKEKQQILNSKSLLQSLSNRSPYNQGILSGSLHQR